MAARKAEAICITADARCITCMLSGWRWFDVPLCLRDANAPMLMLERRRWREQLTKTAQFSAADWLVAAESFVTLAVVAIGIRVTTTTRVSAWASRIDRSAEHALTVERIRRIAWLTDVTGRRVLRMRCLTRSLAVARVLARRGVATDLRIGVRSDEGRLSAHAWVEWQGRALNETARHLGTFAPFAPSLGEVGKV